MLEILGWDLVKVGIFGDVFFLSFGLFLRYYVLLVFVLWSFNFVRELIDELLINIFKFCVILIKFFNIRDEVL